jgi:hypothetical protein
MRSALRARYATALWKLNFADFDRRIVLAVARLNLVLSARLVLQSLELGTAAMSHDFSGDFGLAGIRTTRKLLSIVNGEDFIKSHFAADFSFKALDLDFVARRYPILLSPTANYGVHAASRLYWQTPIISGDWGLRQRGLSDWVHDSIVVFDEVQGLEVFFLCIL